VADYVKSEMAELPKDEPAVSSAFSLGHHLNEKCSKFMMTGNLVWKMLTNFVD